MSIFEAPMLPSPALRQHYAFEVAERIAKVKANLHTVMLDGLGDLALALAHRGIHRWSGTAAELAELLAPRWSRPEATAVVDVATNIGLLIKVGADLLRPRELGHFMWLGARRIASTEDQDQLMDHRLKGPLFDMFAIAPSLVTDADAAAQLVRLYNDREGPWEGLLECGAALAAAAVAWGAPVEDELRYHLLTRAEAWVQPMGIDWNREVGTAILVQEAKAGPFKDEVISLAMVRLTEIASEALGDPDLADNPAVLASLDSQIAIVLAGFGPNTETITTLLEKLPPAHAHRVGSAVAQVLEPGEARNEALVEAANLARAAGDPGALGILSGLVEPLAGVIGPIHDVFQEVIEHPPGELTTVYQGMSACQAIGHWESCPELTLHLLTRLIASSADPDLRIAAAEAVSRHMSRLGRAHEILLETLHGQLELVDRAQAIASCAAALHLGSTHIRLGALALAMVADEGPIDILGRALDAGIRWNPLHFTTFEETLAHYAEDERMQIAGLAILTQVGERAHQEAMLGPFFTLPPLEPVVRMGIARVLLPMVGNIQRPEFSGDAAAACGWILRGDPAFALTCWGLREQAPDDRLKSMYDLAMGATGVADPKVIDRLGRDCAQGSPELSAAAAVALRVLLESHAQGALLEAFLPVIRERAELPGVQQGPILVLLQQLATMPLES